MSNLSKQARDLASWSPPFNSAWIVEADKLLPKLADALEAAEARVLTLEKKAAAKGKKS